MAGRIGGGGAPYATVALIFSATEDPEIGPYIRGRLALAGIDLRTNLSTWLDSVYAAWAEAPVDVLKQLTESLVMKTAMLRPEEARKDWGRRPEHRRMAGSLGKGRGLEAGGRAGIPPTVQRKAQPGHP